MAALLLSRRPILHAISHIHRPRIKMSTKRAFSEPRPSASVILLSPENKILLLHRVNSASFASAHVFPGGNLDPLHDGAVPSATDPARHADGEAYRRAAVRECFEESGILLAKGDGGGLLEVGETERENGRRAIHKGEVRFGEWVERMGGSPDLDGLIPFTRWITPPGVPKRFTTQMYLYLLPTALPINSAFSLPTPDGGVEHTSAAFAPASAWLASHHARTITMFPPQYFLLTLLSAYFRGGGDVERERRAFLEFLERVPTGEGGHFTAGIPWGEKVMSPAPLRGYEDGSVALGVDGPGMEVEAQGGGRGGDFERVIVVNLGKGGPWNFGVRKRADVMDEEEKSKL